MRRLWLLSWTLCVALGTAISAPAAEPADPPRVQTRLERVALFKNGLGYFVRRGELSASPTAALLGPFAAPAHGTFWVNTPATAGLESVIVHETRVKGEEVDARSMAELLKANVGRTVTVWTDAEGKAPLTGTLLSYAPEPPLSLPPTPLHRMGTTRSDDSSALYSAYRPVYGRGDYVLIKTANGVVSISPSAVTRVFFTGEAATRYHTEVPGSGVDLTVRLRSPHPDDWVSLSYLAKGITWAPSYLVDISDPKLAKLSASALIVDEAEDLTDTHVDLITGFPNLQFAEVTSPIAKHTDLAAFLQQLTGGGYRAPVGATANVLSQAVTFGRAEAAPVPEYGLPAMGEQVEDLFFYPLEHVTLRAGDTGYYPLFTISVPYVQVYQWTITDYIDQADRYNPQPTTPDSREIVWHSVRLTNTSQVPWTTAPAETVKNGQILGQDTLNYTPPKAEETLRITQAVNVRAEQRELETAREVDAVRLYGVHFDRVTVTGTLRVSNYKADPITLEVKKTVSGKVTSTTPTAKVRTLASGIARMNATQELTWIIALKPGQKQEITYTYQALIRR